MPNDPTPRRKGRLSKAQAHARAIKAWQTRHRNLAAHGRFITGFNGENEEESRPQEYHQGLPVRSWTEQMAEEAKHYQETGSVSHDFVEELKGASTSDRARFQALIEKDRQRASRSRRTNTGEDDPMIHEDIVEKSARNRLNTVINKNPTASQGVQTRARFITNVIGETQQVDVESPITPEEVHARTEQAINERLRTVDPVTKQTGYSLAPESMINEFRKNVHESYFAATDNDRVRARRQAERLAGRIAQTAQKTANERQTTAHFANEAQKLFGEHQAQQGSGRDKVERQLRTRGALGEERLGGSTEALTAADYYSSAGYDSKPLQRARWELKALLARRKGDEVFDAPKPKVFQQTRQQFNFNKHQTANKLTAAKEGTLSFGLDSSGRVVDPASRNAAVRIGPNRVWRYTIHARDPNDPTKRKAVELPYWDKSQHFDRGSADRPDEIAHRPRPKTYYDEQGNEYPVDQYVLNERLARKWTGPVNVEEGNRELHGKQEKLPAYVSKEVFVPIKGARKASKLRNDPDENYEIKQVRATSGRWFNATPQEWAVARSQGETIGGGLGSTPLLTRTVRMPKKVKTTFVDPSQLSLKRNERDTLTVVLPGKKLSPKFRQQLLDRELIDDNQYKVGERAVEFRLSDGPLNNALLGPVRAQREYSLRKQSKIAAMSKELGVAGATAAYYAQLDRTRKGYIPNKINRGYQSTLTQHPSLRKWARKNNLDSVTLPVEEAYIRPGLEKARNVGYQLRHPTASLEGTSDPGIDFGSVYFRQHGISDEKKDYRSVVKAQRKLDRVVNTQSFVEKHYTDKSLRGKVARWQAEPLQRHQDYRDFYPSPSDPSSGFLAQTIREAREARRASPEGSKPYEAARTLEKRAQGLMREEVTRRNESARNPNRFPVLRSEINKTIIGKPKRAFIRAPNLSPTEQHVVLGAATLATAAGAHYAYHKYQQSKLDPSQRESYYNKVTPGRIRATVPYARSTGHYRIPANTLTNEFNLAGKRPPIQFGVGFHKKTIWKGSPADRGYGKNAKIGLTKLRGAGVKPGGSVKDALTYDPESVFTRKRSWQPAGSRVTVRGKNSHLKANIGPRTPIHLTRTNPHRLTQAGREDLVWAFKDRPDEDEVREFFAFGTGDRVLDLFDDPEAVQKIRRRKGDIGARQAGSSYVVPSYVQQASETESGEGYQPPRRVRQQGQPDIFIPSEGVDPHMWDTPPIIGFMGSGGTAGTDPYSQQGAYRDPETGRHTKYETVFVEGVGQLQERPVGSRRRSADDPELGAADISARGNPRHPMEQRPRRGKQ